MTAVSDTTWKRASPYHVESECGRWSISKSFPFGPEGGPRYTLWERKTSERPAKLIRVFLTFDEAKEAAR
jgi:hypothetical protein